MVREHPSDSRQTISQDKRLVILLRSVSQNGNGRNFKNHQPQTGKVGIYAVHYLNSGGSLFHLQKLLGHEHITTTLHYLKYANLPEAKTISVLDELMKKTSKKVS